jgi:CDP-diacylglycerol--serine O-phosphatidyltransferase
VNYPEQPQIKQKWLVGGRIRRQGIYWLPNAITTAALFGGFYAIVQAMNHRFGWAAVAIFVAMVFDALDGRVARLTRTQSPFGAEYDSLSDMVSFGAAPGLVIYEWALKGMGKLGWVAAFVYCACAALRLARFNTNLGVADKRFFQGLPSPAAAALIAGFVWTMQGLGLDPVEVRWGAWTAWALAMFAGLSMVSNVKFYSGKDINLRKSVPFSAVVMIALGVGAIVLVADSDHPFFNLPELVFVLFVAYAASGYVMWAMRVLRRKSPAPPPPPAST